MLTWKSWKGKWVFVMRKWILAKFVATELLILTARIVDRIRKSWFSRYGQVGSSREKGVRTSFCCDLI